MHATLTVIYWRDIPAQVTAAGSAGSAKMQLSERFQSAIDTAAMKAGLVEANLYLEEWRRESRPCDDELYDVVATEVARLEDEFSPDILLQVVRAGGHRA